MTELKPCPFCGGKAEFCATCMDYAFVKCRECGAKTDNIAISYEYSAKDVAIEAWNRRASDDAD